MNTWENVDGFRLISGSVSARRRLSQESLDVVGWDEVCTPTSWYKFNVEQLTNYLQCLWQATRWLKPASRRNLLIISLKWRSKIKTKFSGLKFRDFNDVKTSLILLRCNWIVTAQTQNCKGASESNQEKSLWKQFVEELLAIKQNKLLLQQQNLTFNCHICE